MTEIEFLTARKAEAETLAANLGARLAELQEAPPVVAPVVVPPVVPARIAKLGVFSPYWTSAKKPQIGNYEAWLGRKVAMVTDNTSETGDWLAITNSLREGVYTWKTRPWLVRIPLLPYSVHGQFAQGAAGAFDAEHQKIALQLKPMLDRGPELPLLVGLGWETNGSWYPWFPKADPGAYKAFFERTVGVYRAVDPRFKFDWNCALGYMHVDPLLIMPNPASFNTMGVDIYDEFPTGQASTYGFGKEAARFKALHKEGAYKLDWWAAKARELGKGLTIPEWGVADWRKPEAGVSGGDDNPVFVQGMADFFDANGDVLVHHSYFERYYKGANHALSRGPTAADGVTPGPSPFPKSAERFKALFGA